ncbi:MAG: hypothetical protein JXR19_00820 [Bacteroidia bacterium]
MKKIILSLSLLLIVWSSFAQAPVDCIPEEFETEEELNAMEPCVLDGANYILKTPLTKVDEEWGEVAVMVVNWMTQTPRSFVLNENMMKICKKNSVLLILYMSALSKAALNGSDDPEGDAVRYFGDYVSNPRNRVEHKGKLKKFVAAFKAEDYDAYI